MSPTESFASYWPELADQHDLQLEVIPEPTRMSDSALAVILVCVGRESEAVDALHDAIRKGISGPIVVGAAEDHRLAVQVMRTGAAAYFALPRDSSRLSLEIEQRVRQVPAPEADEALLSFQKKKYDFDAIIGEHPSIKSTLGMAARVIPGGRVTVLITGDTGTGKELLAQAIHHNGPRAKQSFVAVNCAAIPQGLLESELFGHEKGAFTDARSSKPGLLELAEGGTLFLDEINALPHELQGKLLRVLETRQVRRVGGLRDKAFDVRILAATNVDLKDQVRHGVFREDLYYRLAVIEIRLPPLRERGKDVLLLARKFLTDQADEYGMSIPTLSRAALESLEQHSWPGNVRELRNAMERALLLSGGDPVRPEHLGLVRAERPSPEAKVNESTALPFPATIDEIEAAAAQAMLSRCDGNKSATARRLGIARTRLYRLLERAEV